MKTKFKDKELDYLEKINALKEDNKQIEREYEGIIVEKDRQFEMLKTKFENYKISKGDYY